MVGVCVGSAGDSLDSCVPVAESIMKKPLQAILMASDFHDMCELGAKLITIREGHRSYDLGTAVLCCHIANWCMMVEITSVCHTTIENLTCGDLADDGFVSATHALSELGRFYPSISLDSPVTVIRWRSCD